VSGCGHGAKACKNGKMKRNKMMGKWQKNEDRG